MTALLVSLVLKASACPAEAQPEWAGANEARRRALVQACLDERFDVREEEDEFQRASADAPKDDAGEAPRRAGEALLRAGDDPWDEPRMVPGLPVLQEAERPSLSSGARLERLGGALGGGLLAGGLSAFGLFADGAFCSTLCTLSAFSLPLTVLLGSAAGYAVAGGDPAVLAPAVWFAPAAAFALFAGFFPGLSDTARAAGLATAAATLLAGSAWALLAREDHLVSLGRGGTLAKASGGRVALTVLAGLGLTFLATLSLGIVVGMCGGGCAIPAVAVAAASVTAGEWAAHRANDGEASWTTMFAVLLVHGVALAGAGVAFSQVFLARAREMLVPLSAFALTSALVPALIFEWSHTRSVEARARPAWWAGVAPTTSGAVVSAGLRF